MNQRGVTLIELLIAGFMGSIILLAFGSLFVEMVRIGRYGNAQASLQRQGTLIQEELARRILPAVGLLPGSCGPADATASLQVALEGDFRCFYQQGQNIFECQFTSSNTLCVSNTVRDLLSGSPVPMQARNLTFTPEEGTSVAVSFQLTDGVLDPIMFATRVTIRNIQ